jgi:hypothetical protein
MKGIPIGNADESRERSSFAAGREVDRGERTGTRSFREPFHGTLGATGAPVERVLMTW